MSEKQKKFEQLAEKRVSDAIKKLRLIGNLSNKNNYFYTNEHVKEIIEALESEMKLLKNRFREESNMKSVSFKFKAKNTRD